MSKTVVKNEPIERLLYEDPQTKEKIVYEKDIRFINSRQSTCLEITIHRSCKNRGVYRIGGYASLGKALSKMKPEEVIDQMKKSGLREEAALAFLPVWNGTLQEGERRWKIYSLQWWWRRPGAFMDEEFLRKSTQCHWRHADRRICYRRNQRIHYIRYEYPEQSKA